MTRKTRQLWWIGWVIFTNHFVAALTDGLYQLVAPSVYVAFSGNLNVNYSIPKNVTLPNAFVKLVALVNSDPVPITTHGISLKSEGHLEFTCGVIDFAGPYLLELHAYLDGPILARTSLNVRWPKIPLEIPVNHTAQTNPINLKLSSKAKCNPLFHKDTYHLDLEYLGMDQSESLFSLSQLPRVIHSTPFYNISASNATVNFHCQLFDQAGLYQVVLKMNRNSGSVISRSNIMLTSWSTVYQLNLPSETVFPCADKFTVQYRYPQCPGSDDKIRIFMLRRTVLGSLAAPVDRVYVLERKVDMDQNSMSFDCSLFNTSATGYCFSYVSVSLGRSVTEQDKQCISAYPDSAMPTDGGWSSWSSWGACSVTCGAGKRNRYRMCNNPKPLHGGQFCVGKPIEWLICDSKCTDNRLQSPLRLPLVNKHCKCGCELKNSSGEIIASGRCGGSSVWIISVRSGFQIKLNFVYLDLLENRQWVKIRDGDKLEDELLAFDSGQSVYTEIISTSNKMLVQFMTKPSTETVISSETTTDSQQLISTVHPGYLDTERIRPIHAYGFIATYVEEIDKSFMAEPTQLPVVVKIQPIKWKNTVTIVGIVLCAIIVIAAVAFVFYNKFARKRKPKYAMAAQEETPTHVARSTSMHSSPSRESAGGVEIDQDMERPLTGSSKRKDSNSLLSRGPSISSKASNSYRKIKTKAEIETGGSTKSSPHDYTPLQSPHVARVASENDVQESTGLCRTSPLVKTKYPRSPKIHPSPRLRRESNPTTPLSPAETKHDMLTRKRRETEDKLKNNNTTCQVAKLDKSVSETSSTAASAATAVCAFKTENELDKAPAPDASCPSNERVEMAKFNIKKGDAEIIRKSGSGTSNESFAAQEKKPDSKQLTTSFINEKSKARRPVSLTEKYDSSSPETPTSGKNTLLKGAESYDISCHDHRRRDLPKPDGQSPKSPREENLTSVIPTSSVRDVRVLTSPAKSSSTFDSPARSSQTPSDVVADLELEYDDYVDFDDPFSYFDPEETQKLRWVGANKYEKKLDDDKATPT